LAAYINVLILGEFNQILLVKERGRNEILPGKEFQKPSKWGMPGGVKEADEEEIDTALREATEETGLFEEIEPGIRVEEDAGDHINVTLLGHPVGGKLKTSSSETMSCRWFPQKILWDGNFDIYSSHRRRAQRVLKKLRK